MNKTKVVIFGASEAGKSALRHCQGEYQVQGFIDNNPDKQGTDFCQLPVFGPQQINDLAIGRVLIASEYSEQIAAQLAQLEVTVPWQTLPARMIKPRHFGDDVNLVKNGELLLGIVSEFLIQRGYRHYVDAGTLLGIVRDQAFIAWDDDLDIALHAGDSDKFQRHSDALCELLRELTAQQWQLDWYVNAVSMGAVKRGSFRAAKLSCVSQPDDWPLLDFFVKYIDNDWMDYCLSSRMIRMPAHHFKRTHKLHHNGYTIMLPDDVEGYLTNHYGDWRTPQQDWSLSDLSNTRLIE